MSYEPFVGELDKPNAPAGFQEFTGELDAPKSGTTAEPEVSGDVDQEVVTSARAWRGAGGGRGSFADPRRLDQESGRKLQKTERALDQLEKINPRSREELRPYAESIASAPEIAAKPVDRVQQYVDKANPSQYGSPEGLVAAAQQNASFDQSLQDKRNRTMQTRNADPVTGEKIVQSYNPNTEAQRVKAEEADTNDARLAVIGRSVAEEFNPVIRGIAKGGIQSLGLGAAAIGFAADAMGADGVKAWGLDVNRQTGRLANQLTLSKNATDIQSVDEFQTWLAENGGYTLYQAAESLLAAGVGSVAGKAIGKEAVGQVVAMTANNIRQTLGSVYAEAVDEAKRTGKPMPSLAQIAAGAVVSGAVDTFADKLGLDSMTAAGFKGKALNRLAKSLGTQMGVQGGTEALQVIPETLGAGKDPFTKDGLKQMLDEGAVGALGGGGPGVMGAVNKYQPPAPAIPSAEQMALDRGFLTPSVTSFADPNGPASKAGITPIVVPTPQNVSTPSNTGGLAAGAGNGGSPVVGPSVGGVGQFDVVGRGMGAVAETIEPGGAGNPSVPLVTGQPSTSVNPVKRTADADLLSRVAYEEEGAAPATNATPADSIWTGRSGAGYDTVEAAQQAMESRVKKDPELQWKVEQRPDGKYHLAGYSTGDTNGQAATPVVAGQPAARDSGDAVRNESGLAPQGDPANVRGRENLGDATAAADLSSRIGKPLTLVTPEAVRGLPANSPRARAYRVFNRFAGVAQAAFGYKPVAITGLGQYGVQYDGRAYVDIDEMSDGQGDGVAGMVLHTMGHEVGHTMQKSSDPEDKAAYQGLRSVVVQYAKDGVIARRQRFEDKAAVADGMKAPGRDYAIDEVVNDVNGGMWRDSKFWGMLYDLDSGSTMRRIAYKFMQAATKVIGAAKKNGYNDIDTLVGENIEIVREAAAKAWADRAMRKGKDFKARPALKADLFDTAPSMSRKGVVGEVAPHPGEEYTGDVYGVDIPVPRNILSDRQKTSRDRKETAGDWDGMQADEKTMANRDVAKRIFQAIVDARKLKGWSLSFSTGQYLGKTNPNFIIDASEEATWEQLRDVASEIGFVLDQQSMVAFDENDTSGRHENGFVKLVLPKDFPASKLQELRNLVKEKFPQADSNTQMKPDELVFGNFTKFGDNELSDAEFKSGINAAIEVLDWDGEAILAKDPERYASELIWPDNRLGYLKDQEYGKGNLEQARQGEGRAILRGEQGNRLLSLRKLARESIGRRQDWIDKSASGRARAEVQQRALADATQSTAKAEREYGVAREGSVAKVGVHFSQQRRKLLSSQFHGSGLKGAERDRAQSSDYIKDRLFFYVDSGNGVTPEAGVGGVRHIVKLKNLYDSSKDPKGFSRMSTGPTEQERQTKFENFVKNAGFDGYFMNKGGNQDFAVLIGKHSIEMPSYSRRFKSVDEFDSEPQDFDRMNELGNFSVDTNDAADDFAFPDLSGADKKLDKQAELQAELDQQFRQRMVDKAKLKAGPATVTLEKMQEAGMNPESAFSLGEMTERDGAIEFSGAAGYPEAGDMYEVSEYPAGWRVGTEHSFTMGNNWTKEGAIRQFRNLVTAPFIHKAGFDIAAHYRKGTALKLAQTWRNLAGKHGTFKLPARSKSMDFAEVAKEIGAISGYDIDVQGNSRKNIAFTDKSSGAEFDAAISMLDDKTFKCCTMGLDGSKIGSEFYAVASEWARNNGFSFASDTTLSAVNGFRRTEQATSYALKTEDTGVILPGVQNRVYGYNEDPRSREDHDMNIARLLIAGMRNAMEVDPEIRRLRYVPETGKFTDSKGNDAEATVKAFLSNKDARASGMGRSTLARAVLTRQIIAGGFDAGAVTEFAEPVAYSRKMGVDSALSEAYGSDPSTDGAKTEFSPQFAKWFGDSKVVNENGLPLVVYHGTGVRVGNRGEFMSGDFDAFDAGMSGKSSKTGAPEGSFFFTDKPDVASSYTVAWRGDFSEKLRDGANVMPVYIAMDKPLKVNAKGENWREILYKGEYRDLNEIVQLAKESGKYDGVIVSKVADKGVGATTSKTSTTYVAFSPIQIKSVFNNGDFDASNPNISYARKQGPSERKYQDNYLVPEIAGEFADDSGNIAVMPGLVFAKDGINRTYPTMPIRVQVGEHMRDPSKVVHQYGLQHRIENKQKDVRRGYMTPEVDGAGTAPEVERAIRDIALGLYEATTVYADNAPRKVYLHAPTIDRMTVLERDRDSTGKEFWNVITSMPQTRADMMRRYKAPTTVGGITYNGERTQQAFDIKRGILNKLKEPGQSPVTSESYILDDDGLLFNQPVAETTKAETPVRVLARDANGKIILNKRKAEPVSMSRKTTPTGFYSALAESIETSPSKSQAQDGWRAYLKGQINKGAIKADEVEWSGVNDWLELQTGKVTKERVQAYLDANGVQVQEVTLGGEQSAESKFHEYHDYLMDKYGDEADRKDVAPATLFTKAESAKMQALDDDLDAEINGGASARAEKTKYSQYQLPGGENYREVLLTLPHADVNIAAEIEQKTKRLAAFREMQASELSGADKYKAKGDALEAQLVELRKLPRQMLSDNYTSSHWEQKNVLAHIRLNDRTDADGNKVLFVEEIQSDWGQDGKKRGFSGDVEKQIPAALQDTLRAARNTGDVFDRLIASGLSEKQVNDHPEFLAAYDQERAIKKAYGELTLRSKSNIPSAPFVTKTEGWLNLALKRVIKMAVDGGYDKVAFANGEQSADHYDLSKQVDSMIVGKEDDGSYSIVAMRDGREVVKKDSVPAQDMDGLVGKEMAAKIIDGEGKDIGMGEREFSGLDLKVGGEGMKTFYDKIVPIAAGKLSQKLGGGKMENVGITSDKEGWRITPASQTVSGKWMVKSSDYNSKGLQFDTEAEAKAALAQKVPYKEQPGFAITDAMRDKAAGGMPMFSRKQATGLPEETQLQRVQRVMQDQYNRVKLVQDLLVESGGLVGEEQDVYRAEERMHGRVHELMRQFKDDVVQPFLDKAVAEKVDLNELALYAYAKHAKERNAHIQTFNRNVQTGSGMSDDTADNIIQMVDLAGDRQKFDDLHNDMMAMTATTRRVMLDEGLITQDQYDGLENMYQNYVPLRGFEDVEADTGKVRPGLGRGFNVKGKETIAAMGRDSAAGDIIENIIRDYERVTIRSEKNAVGKTFLDLVQNNPDPNLWEVQPIKRTARKDAGGLVQYVNVDDKGEDTVAVKVAGQPVYIKIRDDLFLRAMQNTFKGEKSDSERFVMRAAGMYTSLLRNTITRFNPVFGVINAVRDSQMGAMGVFDELGAEGLKLYAKHYAGALTAGARTEVNKSDPQKYQMDRWMREMRFAGGTTGGVFMRDNETIRSELRDAMLAAGIAPNGVMDWAKHNTGVRAAKHVLHALEVIGAVSEHAARLSAYTTAREMGKTPAEAASIAKNLTVNFNRFGEQGQLINTLFLFYNAAVQGSVRISQMARNPKVQAAFAGMAGVGLSLALIGAAVGGDDDDGQPYWDKIPDWEKERNIIVMLPPGSESGAKVGKHGRYIKIPMAYGLNVFPVLGYQMADVIRNIKDPTKGSSAGKAAINMVSAVMGSYNPFGGSLSAKPDASWALAVAPTVADPIIQLSQGVDGFGKPTGPAKSQFDKRPDSEIVSGTRHGKVEHRIARYLNEATGGNQAREGGIDLQPGTIKNIAGIVGGGLGKFVGDMVNLGYLGVQDLPIETRDIPVYKAFYGEYDKKAGMSQYYERSQKAMTEFASMKNEMKLGVKRGEYSDEEKFLQRMGGQAEEMSKALGELKKWEVSIAEGEGTDKEKEIKRKEVQKVRERMGADYNRDWYREESKLKARVK